MKMRFCHSPRRKGRRAANNLQRLREKRVRQLHHCLKKDLRVPMSEAAINSELVLFQLPQVQRGVEYTQWMDIRPVNSITSNGSIDIQFKASGAQYIDLQR